MNDCQSDDLQICTQREIPQIQYVKTGSLVHFPEIAGVTESNLTERSDARFYSVQIFDSRAKPHKFLSEIGSFRPGSDNRHRALQHIEELRGFIQFVTPHETTPFCDSRVIWNGEQRNLSFRSRLHASEFIHDKDASVPSNPLLLVYSRSSGARIGYNSQNEIERQKDDDEGKSKSEVQ